MNCRCDYNPINSAGQSGASLAIVGPKDQKMYRKICHVLNKDKGIPFMVPEPGFMEMIQDRVNLARKIDLGKHKQQPHSISLMIHITNRIK